MQIELQKSVKDSQAFVKKMNGLSGTCPTCLQTIDSAKIELLLSEQKQLQDNANSRYKELELIIKQYQDDEARKSAR